MGSQDQVLAAHGGLNQILFQPNNEVVVRPMTLSHDRIDELNNSLLLFYTGIKRTASDVASSYVEHLDARQEPLHRLRELVDESIAVLDSGTDLDDFGKLLDTGWQLKRSLSPAVSNAEVDQIYETARRAGALGGKLTGAGGGGFLLLFARPDRHPAIREQLAGLIHVPFRFEFAGSQTIFFDPEEDYSALDRLRQHQARHAFRELDLPTNPRPD